MNDIPLSVLVTVLVILLCMSVFFSGSETSMTALNRYRLMHLANKNHRGARRVARLLQNMDTLLGTILLGNNFANILASAVTTIIALRLYGEAGVAIGTLGLTLFVLIFAEITPKTFATRQPERIAIICSFVLKPLVRIFSPVIWTLNLIVGKIIKLLVGAQGHAGDMLDRDEVRSLIDQMHIPGEHRSILMRVLELEDETLAAVMTPRPDIAGIDITDNYAAIRQYIKRTTQSRLLVYRDEIDDVVGFIDLRDVARATPADKAAFSALIRQPYFVPEQTTLLRQMRAFRQRKRQIACVVDEYGALTGIVSIEDILEQLVGEFTPESMLEGDDTRRLKDGSIITNASSNIKTLNEQWGLRLPTDSGNTLNGLLLERLGTFPSGRVCMTINGTRFEVLKTSTAALDIIRILPNRQAP